VKIEYTPTLDDVYRVKLALGQPLRRHPLLWVFVLAPVVIAAGATLMAVTGAWLWWGLTLFSLGLSGLTWAALRKIKVTRQQVEREYAGRAWLRTPFRLELTEAGVEYEHGPYRSRSAWSAFKGIAETDSHLILLEKNGPAALAYGISKAEIGRGDGVSVWREFITAQLRRAG
jgi:uncharacterized protein (DUF58 family)